MGLSESEILEIHEAVSYANDVVWGQDDPSIMDFIQKNGNFFNYKSDSYNTIIEMCGFQIWSNQNETRKAIDNGEEDEYEPLEDFLLNELKKFAKMASKLKDLKDEKE